MFFKKDPKKTIGFLQKFCFFAGGGLPSQKEMDRVIAKAEKDFHNSDLFELEYWLGTALHYYTTWFFRGEDRKSYLLKALQHLEKAYILAEGKIPQEIPPKEKVVFGVLDRNSMACEIGKLYIDIAIIRNIDKGISYMKPVYKNSPYYYPHLCSYAEAYYKLGDYLKAAEIALELHRRAKKEWGKNTPPAIMGIVAKSYRAQAKQHKKNGEVEEAIRYFQKMVNMGLASDNDQKILKKLQTTSS